MKELLEKLENNRFIYKVRMDLEFDVKDYQELLKILNEIKHYTHNHKKEWRLIYMKYRN